MRRDMSRVIVERPRLGSRHGARNNSRRPIPDEDGDPVRAVRPARAHIGREKCTKSLNENLAPLKRFLASRVGRPWNKVHSEIAEHIRPTSTVQQHVLDHVQDFVAIRTRFTDGRIEVQTRFGGLVPLDRFWGDFYVHPRTGLLLRHPASLKSRKARWRREPFDDVASRRRDLGPFRQAHRLRDGAWWDVVLDRIPTRTDTFRTPTGAVATREVATPFEDVLLTSGLTPLDAPRLYGRDGVYAVSMRRMTRAERRRAGLG